MHPGVPDSHRTQRRAVCTSEVMTNTSKFWDDRADAYSKKPVANQAAYQRKLEITKARLAKDQRILDIGCGTGSLAIELAPHVKQVHAMDLSIAMVDIGIAKAVRGGVFNVVFHHAAIDDTLPFEPESFDGICAYNVLHLVPDRTAALAKIHRLLKPGGFFISSTACLDDTWVPYGVIISVMQWMGKAPPVDLFKTAELLDDMRDAGFEGMTNHDVGAGRTMAFVVATKPAHAPVSAEIERAVTQPA